MNRFSRDKNLLTAINVNFTNIRSLSTNVAGPTYKKNARILELMCVINIVIDTRTNLEGVNKLFNCNKLKWGLGQFQHQRTYAPAKGILLIYDKSK